MEGTGRSKVFISYSRADLAFTDELAATLAIQSDFEILFDRVGIGHGEAWQERLSKLILECDTMVFVLSPDSVSSEVCAWEIEEARRLSKRIIPILWRAVDFAKVPADLSAINAVPFNGEHAVSGLPKLVTALNSDLTWLREHTRLGERATEWESSGRAAAYLLRGAALDTVRAWIAEKPTNAPAVTELQRVFIQASEEEENRLLITERKRLDELQKAKAVAESERDAAENARANEANAARRVVRATSAGLIVAVILFVAASGAGWLAYQNALDERAATKRANQAATRAEKEATRATTAAAAADAQRDAALLIQSRFLARAARESLSRGDAANAVGLARAALPKDHSKPDRPLAMEPVQVIFDAYGKLRERATLRGHRAGLDGALALAGERILTWDRDGTIRWWRVDGTLLKTVLAHEHPTQPGSAEDTGVHGVLRLDDGRLMSWGIDKTAKLWNDDGTFIQDFLNEASWIQIERLRDGRIAALVGNEYRVWSTALEPLIVLRAPLQWMTGATLLNDGRFLTWQQGPSGEGGKRIYTAMLWSPNGTAGRVLKGHERNIRGAFQLTDGHIVTWENGPSLRIWSADGEIETVIEKAHEFAPQQAFPLRDGRFFTWGQEAHDNNVWWGRLWTAQGDSVPLIEASGSPLKGFELADGRLLLGTNSRNPTIWHTDGTRGPVLRGHERPAYAATQWPDGRIVTRGADHTARIWSPDGVPLLVLRGHEHDVAGVEPLSAEHFLTWSFWDRTARIWSEEPWPRSRPRPEDGDTEKVQQLSSGKLAIHGRTGSLVLFSANLEPGPSLHNAARAVSQLIEMPDGRLLTQGSITKNRQPGPALRMWSSGGEIVADLAGHDAEFLHVALTPAGQILGFARSGQVWVWRSDGQLVGKRKAAHTSAFYRVIPLLDGRFITLGDDNRLQIWSIEGKPSAVVNTSEATTPRQIVTFGDGRFLIIAWNGPPRIWEENGNPGPALEIKETSPAMTATPLQDGSILLNRVDGRLLIMSSDGSFRELHHQPEPGGQFQRHDVFKLADGRLLVSTSNQGTRIWSANGAPGRHILDESISGATLLSDGSFLVWPVNRHKLQIIQPDGQLGPVLRGHESTIQQSIQMHDGRILSWAEDGSVRIWPGSIDQAIAWADEVVSRLRPLTLAERCEHYLEPTASCVKVEQP